MPKLTVNTFTAIPFQDTEEASYVGQIYREEGPTIVLGTDLPCGQALLDGHSITWKREVNSGSGLVLQHLS